MLDELITALDTVCEADSAALGDGESIEILHRCLARLEAVTTRASAAFDAGGHWRSSGARSAAAWVATRCRVPEASARARVRTGRALRHLPATEAAWSAGTVGRAQVSALVRAATPARAEALERDEPLLVDQAASLGWRSFSRALAYWCQRADPDGSDAEDRAGRDGRRLHLSASLSGTWLGDLVLDPISGAIVAGELARIEAELFEADWSDARGRGAEATSASELSRTPAQRRADALVEMARRSGTAPADGRRPEPLFSVLVGYETLAGRICELADGTVVSPGSLVGWLDQAWVERVVFDGPSRVIDVGVTRRLFAGATRRAVQVRDRQCFHEYCDIPAEACQVDHIEPWAAGGLTVVDNGRAACACHNRRRHRRP